MRNSLLQTLSPGANGLKDRTAFLVLGLLAFLIRFPFFFRDYIDRDESTFILMGQSWVNGHLPYTELWDLKPPLVFLFFAGMIYLFGKSFIAIRLVGVLVVAITAFCTYLIGKQMHSRPLGFWAALSVVSLLSLFGSLQGVMSEHLSMLYFMPGLTLLIRKRDYRTILGAGLLMGLAVMTKINLAYAVALLALFLLYEEYATKQYTKGILKALLFGSGVLLVVLLTWLPYALEGQSVLWWNSVVLAPLEYTGTRRYSVIKMAPIVLITGFFFFLSARKKWLSFKDPGVQLLSLAVIGVVLSFIKGGRVNGHYLIQFHPAFLVLFAMVLIKAVPPISRRWRPLLLLLLLLPLESYKEYYDVARHKLERGTFYNGEGFSVPAYLLEHHMASQPVFFLEYHIGYWLLDISPPTRAATHPSNLCRDEAFKFYGNPRETSMEELAYIMEELQPEVVVTRYERRIFDQKEEAENQYMLNYLAKHYKVVALVDRAEIHQLLK